MLFLCDQIFTISLLICIIQLFKVKIVQFKILNIYIDHELQIYDLGAGGSFAIHTALYFLKQKNTKKLLVLVEIYLDLNTFQ